MWQELGMEEMSDCDEDPATVWDEVDSGGQRTVGQRAQSVTAQCWMGMGIDER